MNKRPKNLDMNQLAKRIVDEAVGDEPVTSPPPEKNQAVVDKRRLDGLKGGVARAEKLTAEQRSEIAKLAASIRWHKVD
ncbi:MAG: hypothetical protein DID92_2727744767 [Candidatus Nitrotoga sp. SPKER]|nr:MAG: hypothetical protein DID92_2727744767 [Candidatus Nitrotoga sp. SPKER]